MGKNLFYSPLKIHISERYQQTTRNMIPISYEPNLPGFGQWIGIWQSDCETLMVHGFLVYASCTRTRS